MPSYRTATFNGVALGDYIAPIENHILDNAEKFSTPHSYKKVFESNTPIGEAEGNNFSDLIVIFTKDVSISTSLNTDLKMREWFEGTYKPAITPTAGSQTAYSLVETDGSTTITRTNCQHIESEIIHNSYGIMKVKVTFRRKGA